VIFLDCADFLAEAIESVLAQTYPSWELLLVDDGSTDGSGAIARVYEARTPERIRVLSHAGNVNRGMSASRNLGIRHARGKYIAPLDGDDVWLPRKLERQVALLEAEPDVGMVFGLTKYWHSWTGRPEDARRDETPVFALGGHTRFDPPSLLTLSYPLGEGRAPCQCSLLLRADAVHRAGGYEERFTGFYEDQVFLSKVYLAERVAFLEECHDRYRVHERSCSAAVRREGRYESHRASYLRWLQEHLERRGERAPGVREKLSAALEPRPRQIPAVPGTPWLRLLRVAAGGSARLEISAIDPERVRIAIARVGSGVPYDIQLNLPRLGVSAGERYVVCFAARADDERTLGVGVADGRSPWQNLGLYETLDVSPGWRHFTREFTATRDQEDARVHFDVGAHAASVELAAVTLVSLVDGRSVRPEPLGGRGGGGAPAAPPLRTGGVDFGDLRRLQPISPDFGCDRGRPVDRWYIERFLAAHSADVQGRVLEVGERTYTRAFGGSRVTESDVLHVSQGDPEATIVADLARADHVPSDAFDCAIVTQTLQLVWDVAAAVRTLHRILKPGGVALVTLPGISQTYDSEWGSAWYWNFTDLSARRLFEDAFGAGNVRVDTHGNVLAAISFLHGIAQEELTRAELEHQGAGYHVTIAVRAVKGADPGPPAAADPRNPEAADGRNRPVSEAADARDGAVPAGAPAGRGGSGPARAPTRVVPGPARAGEAGHGGGRRGVVLAYHRVSTGHADPWSLCVSPSRFAEQLEWLRAHTTPLTVSALIAGCRGGTLPENAVALTFDDGYADNLLAAAPLLREASLPATFYVSAAPWPATREFWWDELEGLLLGPGELPDVLRVSVAGGERRWTLGASPTPRPGEPTPDAPPVGLAETDALSRWRAADGASTPRQRAFLELWRLLQSLPPGPQEATLDQLRGALGRPDEVRATHRRLTHAEIAALASLPSVEIGGHGATHALLPGNGAADQLWEIETNRALLEGLAGRPVTTFAYPYGAWSEVTISQLRRAGFSSACTTEPGGLLPGGDPLRVPRVTVLEWGAGELERRLTPGVPR
jgi:peptidoglycan/xylan/chitin deacetylase (PgdA/CDA1 family)/GT2 family glycosyltransferase/SAM-dependent methyltransferase